MKLWRNHISLVTGEWNYELTVGIKNEDSVVFSAVVSRSCGPASSPGWVIVLCFGTRYSQRLSPPRRVWELSCEIWRNDAMDWYLIKGWDARLLVALGHFKGRKGPVTLSRPFLRSYEFFPFLGLVHLWEFFSVFQSLFLPWNKDLWERQCTMPLN